MSGGGGGGGQQQPVQMTPANPTQFNPTPGGWNSTPQTFTQGGMPPWAVGAWGMPWWGMQAANPGQPVSGIQAPQPQQPQPGGANGPPTNRPYYDPSVGYLNWSRANNMRNMGSSEADLGGGSYGEYLRSPAHMFGQRGWGNQSDVFRQMMAGIQATGQNPFSRSGILSPGARSGIGAPGGPPPQLDLSRFSRPF